MNMQEATYKKQADGSVQVTLEWKLPTSGNTDEQGGRETFTNDDLQYTIYQQNARTQGDWTQVGSPVSATYNKAGNLTYTFTADASTTQTGSVMNYAVRCSLKSGKQAGVESINPTPIMLLYTGNDTQSANVAGAQSTDASKNTENTENTESKDAEKNENVANNTSAENMNENENAREQNTNNANDTNENSSDTNENATNENINESNN